VTCSFYYAKGPASETKWILDTFIVRGGVVRPIIFMLTLTMILTGCNTVSPYSLQDAKGNGDIVVGPGGPLNTEKIISFISNVEKDQESKLRITSFTDEGDPIISDLYFDGEKIQYRYDSSRDKFGGKTRGKSKTSCERIGKREVSREGKAEGTQYILTGCRKIIGVHESGKKEIFVLFVER